MAHRIISPGRGSVTRGSVTLGRFTPTISLIIGLFFIPATNAKARVIQLPQEYKTIQQAINESRAGDEIKLAAGIYKEHISLKPGLSLSGEDPQTTVIAGADFFSRPIVVLNGKCTLAGITIKGANTESKAAVYVEAGSPRIYNCTITGNRTSGIFVEKYASPVIEQNRIFKNSGSAIDVFFASPKILANRLYDNRGYGILINGAAMQPPGDMSNAHKTQTAIIGNTIENNKGGAIMCQDSSPTIKENKIINKRGRSILLVNSDAIIKANEITGGGPPAIYIESGNPVIEENTITGVMRFAILGESKLGSIKNNKVKTMRGELLEKKEEKEKEKTNPPEP